MSRAITLVGLVAALLIAATACDDGDDEAAETAGTAGTAEFVAGDQYFEDLPETVEAGTVEFVMTNEGVTEHDLIIEELDDKQVVPATAGGETGRGTVELERGTYTLYCSIPGHRAQMEATLDVE